MGRFPGRRVGLLLVIGVVFGTGWVLGQQKGTSEKAYLHIFAFTTREGITQKDHEEFTKATAGLGGTIPGLKRIWVGKLATPLQQGNRKRTYAVAMEFENEKAHQGYGTSPVRIAWRDKFFLNMAPSNDIEERTTLDIRGE